MFDEKLKKILDEINPKTIIEFGSYDGADAIKYRQWYPDAEIYSVEANPIGFDKLKNKLNKYNIKCFNYAIGNKTGESKLFYSIHKKEKGLAGCASILKSTDKLKNQASHLQFLDVPINTEEITLNLFCQLIEIDIHNIDFLHIDVDGYIKEVLEGMGRCRPKIIYAEIIDLDKLFIGASTTEECNKILNNLGYVEILRNPEELAIVYKYNK